MCTNWLFAFQYINFQSLERKKKKKTKIQIKCFLACALFPGIILEYQKKGYPQFCKYNNILAWEILVWKISQKPAKLSSLIFYSKVRIVARLGDYLSTKWMGHHRFAKNPIPPSLISICYVYYLCYISLSYFYFSFSHLSQILKEWAIFMSQPTLPHTHNLKETCRIFLIWFFLFCYKIYISSDIIVECLSSQIASTPTVFFYFQKWVCWLLNFRIHAQPK